MEGVAGAISAGKAGAVRAVGKAKVKVERSETPRAKLGSMFFVGVEDMEEEGVRCDSGK